jgi:hypothetical protein
MGSRVVGAGPLFQGRQHLIAKPARKSQRQARPVELSVLAHLIGKSACNSRRRQMRSKASRIVGAGSLFQGRQHLIGKSARKSRRRQMGSKASRIVGAGSLFQGRQHLIGKSARKSLRRQGTLSRLHKRFLLVSKSLQWRAEWFRRQTEGILMDSGG